MALNVKPPLDFFVTRRSNSGNLATFAAIRHAIGATPFDQRVRARASCGPERLKQFSPLPKKAIMLVVAMVGLKMFEKIYVRKWARRDWVLFSTFVVIAIAGITVGHINDPTSDITGAVSTAAPPMKQDGSPAHPYADASQCPHNADLVFWPHGRSIPSMPPSISVCFVGNQSFSNGGPDLEVRGR